VCTEMERVMEASSIKGSILSVAKENDWISRVGDAAEYWVTYSIF